MMPTRRRTRAQNRAAHIARERELNAVQLQRDHATAIQAAAERVAKHQARQRVAVRGYFHTVGGTPPAMATIRRPSSGLRVQVVVPPPLIRRRLWVSRRGVLPILLS